MITRLDNGTRFVYFPPFRGTPEDAVFYNELPPSEQDPSDERGHIRILRVNGQEFLVLRLVHRNDIVNYWIAGRAL